MDLNYERDLFIDKSVLDEECVDQPVRFARWARLHAEAVAERDRIKHQLSVIRAEVEAEVRKEFESGKREGKGTEAQVKAAIDLNVRVRRAEDGLIEAGKQVNLLAVARDALSDRRRMLESLVALWLSTYWSDVRVPKQRTSQQLEDLEERRQREYLGRNNRLSQKEQV